MTKFDEVVKLIGDVRRLDFGKTSDCVALMKEFLRREALWAEQLDLADEIPFADLSGATPGTDYAKEHLDTIKSFAYSAAESRCCSAMLNWYGRADSCSSALRALRLPDPYLPLLHFFRLGGTFAREHREFIDVNGKMTIQAGLVQNGDLGKSFVNLKGEKPGVGS